MVTYWLRNKHFEFTLYNTLYWFRYEKKHEYFESTKKII